MIPVRPSIVCSHSASLKIEIVLIISPVYCAVQKNSVPAAAGAVATSHTVFLLNRELLRVPFNELSSKSPMIQ